MDDDDFIASPPCLSFPGEAIVRDKGMMVKVNKAGYKSPVNKKATLHGHANHGSTPSGDAIVRDNGMVMRVNKAGYKSPVDKKATLYGTAHHNSSSQPHTTSASRRKLQAETNGAFGSNSAALSKKQKKKLQQLEKQAQLRAKVESSQRNSKLAGNADMSLLRPTNVAANSHQLPYTAPYAGDHEIPGLYYQQSSQVPVGYPTYPNGALNEHMPIGDQQAAPLPDSNEVPWVFKALGQVWDNGRKIFAPPEVNRVQVPVEHMGHLPGSLTPETPMYNMSGIPEVYDQPHMEHQMNQPGPPMPYQPSYVPYNQQLQYPYNLYSETMHTPWNLAYNDNIGREMPSPGKIGFHAVPASQEEFAQEGIIPAGSTLQGTPAFQPKKAAKDGGNSSFTVLRSLLLPLVALVLSVTALTITDASEPSTNVIQQVAGMVNTMIRSGALISLVASTFFILYKYTTFSKAPPKASPEKEVYFAGQSLEHDPFYWQTVEQAQEIARSEMERYNKARYMMYSPIPGPAELMTPGLQYDELYHPPATLPPHTGYYMPNNYMTTPIQPAFPNQYFQYPSSAIPGTLNVPFDYGLTPQVQFLDPEIPEKQQQNKANKKQKKNAPKTPVVQTSRVVRHSPQSDGTSPIFGGLFNLPSPLPPPVEVPGTLTVPAPSLVSEARRATPGPTAATAIPAPEGKTSMQDYLKNIGVGSTEPEKKKLVTPIPPTIGAFPPGYLIPNSAPDPTILASNKGYVHHFSFLPAGTMLEGMEDNSKSDLLAKKKLRVLDLAKDEDFRKEILREMEGPGNGLYLSMPPLPNIDDPADRGLPRELFNLNNSVNSYGNPHVSLGPHLPADGHSRASSAAPSAPHPGLFGTPFNNVEFSLLEAALNKASQKKEPKEKKDGGKKDGGKKDGGKKEESKENVPFIDSACYVDKYSCKPYGPPPKRYRAIQV